MPENKPSEDNPEESTEEEIPEEEVTEPEPAPANMGNASPPTFSFEKLATGLIPKPAPKNELADLFQVPQAEDNDMYVDDLFAVPEEELDMEDDLSDLTQVSREDVMGKPPKPRLRYTRTKKPYAGPTTMGSIQ
jgi:hypothetical protein